jgi:hypothetical protein
MSCKIVAGRNEKRQSAGSSGCDCHDLLSASLAMTNTKIQIWRMWV